VQQPNRGVHGALPHRQAEPLVRPVHQRRGIGQVAVPFGVCAEPSNVKAGGGACQRRFERGLVSLRIGRTIPALHRVLRFQPRTDSGRSMHMILVALTVHFRASDLVVFMSIRSGWPNGNCGLFLQLPWPVSN
jgi:hypothetical protein